MQDRNSCFVSSGSIDRKAMRQSWRVPLSIKLMFKKWNTSIWCAQCSCHVHSLRSHPSHAPTTGNDVKWSPSVTHFSAVHTSAHGNQTLTPVSHGDKHVIITWSVPIIFIYKHERLFFSTVRCSTAMSGWQNEALEFKLFQWNIK